MYGRGRMIEELVLDDQTLGTLHELRASLRRRIADLQAESGLLAVDYDDWRQAPVPDPPSVDERRHIPAYRVLRERVVISLTLLELAEELEEVDAAIARRHASRPQPPPVPVPVPVIEKTVVRPAPSVLARPQPQPQPLPPASTRERVDSRKVIAGVAAALVLLAIALVAVVMTNSSDEDPTVEVLPPQAVVATPINWRDTGKAPQPHKGPCIWRPALTIADGASLRGQTAVVMLSGPDFAQKPTREVTVNKNGVVTFRVDLKNCSRIHRDDASLVSVNGNQNVNPAPPG